MTQYGIGVPNVALFADPRFLVCLGQRAEDSGWDGFFVWDHLTYREPDRSAVDSWSVIAAVAAVTQRVRLGVLLTALPRRQPALFAQQAATVDLLSQGRLVVGVGLGSMAEEYSAFGFDDSVRIRARQLDEALEVVAGLWSGGPVEHAGEFYRVRTPGMLPRPQQTPTPPIWIGGRWPNRAPFHRAARFDGVMPTHAAKPHGSFMAPDDLHEIVQFVLAAREASLGRFDVVMEGESETPQQLAQLVPGYKRAGLTWWIEKLGWWRGDRDAAVRRVQRGPA